MRLTVGGTATREKDRCALRISCRDDVSRGEIDGVSIRGSVGAFRQCPHSRRPRRPPQDRDTAERDLIALLPAMRALGLFDVFAIRDEKLRALVEQHLSGS